MGNFYRAVNVTSEKETVTVIRYFLKASSRPVSVVRSMSNECALRNSITRNPLLVNFLIIIHSLVTGAGTEFCSDVRRKKR